jgi:2-polyprenyl-3-methyl-5-hydroxy-6-metoxy-1,4-benzoquinol methylase
MPKCLFCESPKHTNTPFEDTLFNGKTFRYLACADCRLVYVDPLPLPEDLIRMYPVEYQGEPVVSPSGHYDDILGRIAETGTYATLLDYGCGGGRFVTEAIAKGYKVTGTEYNPEMVEALKKAFPQASFSTVAEFGSSVERYDVIYLSNVLEHLTDPKGIMQLLKQRLNPSGIFVIEGPVENNFNLTLLLKKLFFFMRKNVLKKTTTHPPHHIFYSDRKNQEDFFKRQGLSTLYYKINETNWPFPMNYAECDTFTKKLMYAWASCSVTLGKNFSFWGNYFVYIGTITENKK